MDLKQLTALVLFTLHFDLSAFIKLILQKPLHHGQKVRERTKRSWVDH